MSDPDHTRDQKPPAPSYREIAAEALRGTPQSGLAVARQIDDVFIPTQDERNQAQAPIGQVRRDQD